MGLLNNRTIIYEGKTCISTFLTGKNQKVPFSYVFPALKNRQWQIFWLVCLKIAWSNFWFIQFQRMARPACTHSVWYTIILQHFLTMLRPISLLFWLFILFREQLLCLIYFLSNWWMCGFDHWKMVSYVLRHGVHEEVGGDAMAIYFHNITMVNNKIKVIVLVDFASYLHGDLFIYLEFFSSALSTFQS